MIIKYPNENRALIDLWRVLNFAENNLKKCISRNHDCVTVFYLSTYTMTRSVSFKGISILEKLKDIIDLSPEKVICVIRATTPCYFSGFMRKLQQESIDFLRDKCYVITFSPRREFLNHAKFLISYYFCFTEDKIYRQMYYGSTNFTIAGLSRPSKSLGNYEEYTVVRKYSFNRRDLFYIKEIYDLMLYNTKLYTDQIYLKKFLRKHIKMLEYIYSQIIQTLRNNVLNELLEMFITTQISYYQTLSLLSQLPGKELTYLFIDRLEKEYKPPYTPFELEIMCSTEENLKRINEYLNLDRITLREKLETISLGIEKMRGILKDYLLKISNIENIVEFKYLDDKERSFIEFLKNYSEIHKIYLEKYILR